MAGYYRSSKKYREKVKALKRKYKDVVDRLRRSGVGVESDDEEVTVRDFRWFHELHSVMKGRPVSHPLHVVDSAKATVSSPHSGSSSSITCGPEGAGKVQPQNDNDSSCSD